MSTGDFGGTIRRSRERLGLTTNRVAELIGRAPGTVRAWERGTVVPDDPSVVSSLAAVLGLDEIALFRTAGLEPPVVESAPTVEQALRTIVPDPGVPETKTAVRDVPSTASVPVAAGKPAASPKESSVPADPTTDLPPRAAAHRRESSVSILDKLRAATVRKPRVVAAPLTTLPAAPAPRSYLEDPEERWSYKLRSIYTAAGVGLLLIMLAWAAGNLADALGATWDLLTSGL